MLSWDTTYCQEMHDSKFQDLISWRGTWILFQMSTEIIQCYQHRCCMPLLFSLFSFVSLFWAEFWYTQATWYNYWLRNASFLRTRAKILKAIVWFWNYYAQTFQCNSTRWPSGVSLLVSVEINYVQYLIHFDDICRFWLIFRGSRRHLNWRMP